MRTSSQLNTTVVGALTATHHARCLPVSAHGIRLIRDTLEQLTDVEEADDTGRMIAVTVISKRIPARTYLFEI